MNVLLRLFQIGPEILKIVADCVLTTKGDISY